MRFLRQVGSGTIGILLSVSLASVACDSANNAENASPSGYATTESEPKPESSADAPAVRRTPIAALTLSACLPAGYSLPLSIAGSAPFDVTLDTGSTSLGVASSSCTDCKVTPKFSASGSVVDEREQAKSQYVTGGWSGEIYQGDVSLDAQTKASVKFVGIEKQQDFFVSQSCGSKSGSVQGIIGLGPASGAVDGTTGFLDQFIAESNAHDLFATKLCDDGGLLWIGGYDATETTGEPRYTPLLKGLSTAYTVGLDHIDVDGTTVPVASTRYPSSPVDTGSSAFLLSAPAFAPLTSA
jgi:hypothetical protein